MQSQKDDNSPIDPQVSARIQKYMQGYEDAPEIYRLDRFFVCETAYENGWDDAEVEKVLDRRMNEMLKDGDITPQEYEKIKEVVKRETEKKL